MLNDSVSITVNIYYSPSSAEAETTEMANIL